MTQRAPRLAPTFARKRTRSVRRAHAPKAHALGAPWANVGPPVALVGEIRAGHGPGCGGQRWRLRRKERPATSLQGGA